MRFLQAGYTHFQPQIFQGQVVGFQLQHGVWAVQQQAQPDRAVVQQLRGYHLVGLQPQGAGDLGQQRRVRCAALQRRRGKRQPLAVTANPHQAHTAFLGDVLWRVRHTARLQPGVAGAQGRVAGKRQLGAGGEDAHAVVRSGGRALGRGRQHKRGFRQVSPVREMLHVLGGEVTAIQHHGQRVAQVGRVGEDVNLLEGARCHAAWRARLAA